MPAGHSRSSVALLFSDTKTEGGFAPPPVAGLLFSCGLAKTHLRPPNLGAPALGPPGSGLPFCGGSLDVEILHRPGVGPLEMTRPTAVVGPGSPNGLRGHQPDALPFCRLVAHHQHSGTRAGWGVLAVARGLFWTPAGHA